MKIFLSYRRNDAPHATARIYRRLADDVGENNVFMDVDSLRHGANFRKSIRLAIQDSDYCLFVIGKQWAAHKPQGGRSRLQEPGDFVRLEVEVALKTPSVTVIPVLIDGATLPSRDALPKSLYGLLDRQAVSIRSGEHFDRDLNDLVSVLEVVPEMSEDDISLFDGLAAHIDWSSMPRDQRETVQLVLLLLVACIEGKRLSTDKLQTLLTRASLGKLDFG